MSGVLIVVSGDSIAHSLRPLPVALLLRRRGVEVRFAGSGPHLRFLKAEGFAVESFPVLAYARVQRWQFDDLQPLYGRGEIARQVEAQAGASRRSRAEQARAQAAEAPPT